MMHVSHTKPSDYTAHEQYVAEMLEKDELTSFFPINRSMALAMAKETSVGGRWYLAAGISINRWEDIMPP